MPYKHNISLFIYLIFYLTAHWHGIFWSICNADCLHFNSFTGICKKANQRNSIFHDLHSFTVIHDKKLQERTCIPLPRALRKTSFCAAAEEHSFDLAISSFDRLWICWRSAKIKQIIQWWPHCSMWNGLIRSRKDIIFRKIFENTHTAIRRIARFDFNFQ